MNIKSAYISGFVLLLFLAVSFFFLFYLPENENEIHEDDLSSQPALIKRTDLKSMVVTMKSVLPFMGSDVETKVYFDDFGQKYCTVTDTKLNYKEHRIVSTEISLVKDGYNYTYNPEKKTGTKVVNVSNFNPTKINFAKLDAQTMREHGIEKQGNEMILDRECEVFTINYPALKMSGRYHVWQNIPLRTKTSIGDVTIEMIATQVEENVPIPSRIFEIPKDIKFTEPSGATTSPSELSSSDSL